MQYLLLFLEGVITFISPCLLPVLPIYISYFSAGEANKNSALVNSFSFVLGFTIIFVALGAFAGTLGGLVQRYSTILNIATGSIIIILGLNFMGILNIVFLNRTRHIDVKTQNLNFLSSMLFGIVFAIGWTPCVGTFLGSALMIASASGHMVEGILMLLVYSLGLGIPFILSTILINHLKGTFDFIKRNYKIINLGSGILLIVVGILMATGLMGYFLSLLTF